MVFPGRGQYSYCICRVNSRSTGCSTRFSPLLHYETARNHFFIIVVIFKVDDRHQAAMPSKFQETVFTFSESSC